jgi:hypothetical protein
VSDNLITHAADCAMATTHHLTCTCGAYGKCKAVDYPVWADGSQTEFRCILRAGHKGSHAADGGEWRWQT